MGGKSGNKCLPRRFETSPRHFISFINIVLLIFIHLSLQIKVDCARAVEEDVWVPSFPPLVLLFFGISVSLSSVWSVRAIAKMKLGNAIMTSGAPRLRAVENVRGTRHHGTICAVFM